MFRVTEETPLSFYAICVALNKIYVQTKSLCIWDDWWVWQSGVVTLK